MKYRNCALSTVSLYAALGDMFFPMKLLLITSIKSSIWDTSRDIKKITVIYEQQSHEFSCLGPISGPRRIKPFIFYSYTSYLQLLSCSYINIHTKTEIKQTRKLFEQWNPDHRKQSMGNFGNAKFTVLRLNLSNTMLSKSALQRASNHIMLLIKFEKYMEAMSITSQWLFSLVWLTALENFQRI